MDVRSGNAGLVLEGPMACFAILLDLLQNQFHYFCTNASELATSVHIDSSIFNNIYSGTVITEICTILWSTGSWHYVHWQMGSSHRTVIKSLLAIRLAGKQNNKTRYQKVKAKQTGQLQYNITMELCLGRCEDRTLKILTIVSKDAMLLQVLKFRLYQEKWLVQASITSCSMKIRHKMFPRNTNNHLPVHRVNPEDNTTLLQ